MSVTHFHCKCSNLPDSPLPNAANVTSEETHQGQVICLWLRWGNRSSAMFLKLKNLFLSNWMRPLRGTSGVCPRPYDGDPSFCEALCLLPSGRPCALALAPSVSSSPVANPDQRTREKGSITGKKQTPPLYCTFKHISPNSQRRFVNRFDAFWQTLVCKKTSKRVISSLFSRSAGSEENRHAKWMQFFFHYRHFVKTATIWCT